MDKELSAVALRPSLARPCFLSDLRQDVDFSGATAHKDTNQTNKLQNNGELRLTFPGFLNVLQLPGNGCEIQVGIRIYRAFWAGDRSEHAERQSRKDNATQCSVWAFICWVYWYIIYVKQLESVTHLNMQEHEVTLRGYLPQLHSYKTYVKMKKLRAIVSEVKKSLRMASNL